MATTRTSIRSGEEARQRILDAAYELFAAHGFHGTSVGQIAESAGVSRPGVLYHFSNKQAVLIALLESRDRTLALDEESLPAPTLSAIDMLAGMPSTIRAILEDRTMVRLAHSLTGEAVDPSHPAHEWLTKRYRLIREGMGAAFAESYRRGELEPIVDAAVMGSITMAIIEGLEAQWLADPGAVDVEAGISGLAALIHRSESP